MPSSSKKQHNFMAAVAHSPSFAKKVGVPQSVGKDFTVADKGKKFMNPRARKKGGKIVKMAKGGMRTKANWNTWEPADEEETKVSDFTPSDSFDEDEESEGVKSSNQARMREARARRRGADTQHTVPNLLANAVGSQTDAEEEAPKKQSFGEAFRAAKGSDFTWNGKKYSGKTKEQSSKSKDKEQEAPVPAAKRNEPSVLPKASRGALGKSRESKTDDTPFLSRGKDNAAGAVLSRSPKLSAPKDEPLEESHPEDLLGIGKAVVGLGTAAALGRRALPKILSKMGKVGAGVEERARAARLARYEQDNAEAYRGMKKGGKVKAYAAGGSVRGGGCESKGKTKGRFR